MGTGHNGQERIKGVLWGGLSLGRGFSLGREEQYKYNWQ